MLKQRIMTALVLLAILLPALFAKNPAWLMGVALVLISLAAWEWGQLNGYSKKASWFMALDVLLLCALAWKLNWHQIRLPIFWSVVSVLWMVGAGLLLAKGVAGWAPLPKWLRVGGGLLALWAAWLAVAQAKVVGVNFLLSLLVIVWVADIGAYFAGRRFGKKKLAPGISPGKSWEGVYGGLAAACLLALAWVLQASAASNWGDSMSLYQRLYVRAGVFWLILGTLLMVCMSVVGDLIESLVKRSAGAKDSSNLLPGHGGVLDRVDALLPTLPIGMMLASWLM
jgi:phosphatidate cytidylyltransferase